jgi:hypothetical protein
VLSRHHARVLIRLRQELPLFAGMVTLAAFLATPVGAPAFPYARVLLFAWLFITLNNLRRAMANPTAA